MPTPMKSNIWPLPANFINNIVPTNAERYNIEWESLVEGAIDDGTISLKYNQFCFFTPVKNYIQNVSQVQNQNRRAIFFLLL